MIPSNILRLGRTSVALVTVATMATVSSCSGSHSNAVGGGAKADTASAKALVQKYTGPMTSVGLPPLKAKPAAGKKVAIVLNNTPGSLSLKDGAVAAAKVLGWTAVPVVYDPSKPTGLVDAFAQAVDDNPDGIITTALNQSDYAQSAATLKQRGIPVVTSTTTDPVSSPVIANVSNADSWAEAGRIAAAYVIDTVGGKASVAMFNIPSFPVLAAYEAAFKDEFHTLCAGCHYETHPVQAGDIGTAVPAQVVSAVQRTPTINIALMGFGAVSTGVSAALTTAGLKSVKVLGISASMDNLTALAKGTEQMWVGFPLQTLGWKSIDALARHFNGEPVDITTSVKTPVRVLTHDNVGAHPGLPEVVNYQSIFEQLWHVVG